MSKNISNVAAGIVILVMLSIGDAMAQGIKPEWKSFEEAIEVAQKEQRMIVVDVWAPWCGWCKKMQKEVYPELTSTLNENFVLTRLNRDDNETRIEYGSRKLTQLRLSQELNVQEVPAVIFLSSEGEYLFHLQGFINPYQFNSVLKKLMPVEVESSGK